jgi:hypothetical protein
MLGAIITDVSQIPTLFEGYNASTGHGHNFQSGKTVTKRLPEPYINCKENIENLDSDLAPVFIQNNIIYTQKFFYNLCFQKYLIKD